MLIVEGIDLLWNEFLTQKEKDYQDDYLEDSLSDDMFEHVARHDMFMSGIGFSIEQFIRWRLGSQCQRSKCVHDQVDPQHLDGC